MRGSPLALVTASFLASTIPAVAQEIGTIPAAPRDTFAARWEVAVDEYDTAPDVFAVRCPGGGGFTKSVWGTDEYTDDSGVCVAAVHAGIIDANGGVAIVQRRPGRDAYRGSQRHGVTSRDYGAWPRSFRFVRVGATGTGARPADVGSLDGIIRAFYDVVSGPAGTPRQWDRDATLYHPGATFTIAHEDGPPQTMSPSQWSEEVDEWLVTSGFTEREIHRVTREFGRMAHVWSTYEWQTADGRTGRGINSIHLWNDGGRWWITHATWEDERPDNPIAAEFLP
jgi:hypothetical protein